MIFQEKYENLDIYKWLLQRRPFYSICLSLLQCNFFTCWTASGSPNSSNFCFMTKRAVRRKKMGGLTCLGLCLPVQRSEKLISSQPHWVEQLPQQAVLASRLRGCYWTTLLFSACYSKVMRVEMNWVILWAVVFSIPRNVRDNIALHWVVSCL